MIRYKILLVFCLFAFAKAESQQAPAKEKQEREEKIKMSDFPATALILVKEIVDAPQKVNYYKETDGQSSSYEAKLKYRGARYSIEFDEQGVLEDVEIEIEVSEIEKNVAKKINKQLENMARRYRIEKVQRHYNYKDKTLTQLLLQIDNQQPDAFELIVAFKDQRKIYRKELSFDRMGKLIQQRMVKRLEYDFLLF